jgi:hypothetical protein
MSNNAAPAVDAEMQQFQDDLLQSIREFKEGNFAKITKINTEVANEKILDESVSNYSVRL